MADPRKAKKKSKAKSNGEESPAAEESKAQAPDATNLQGVDPGSK